MIKILLALVLAGCATRTVPEKVDERAPSSTVAKEALPGAVTRSLTEDPSWGAKVETSTAHHHGEHHAR